MKKILVAIDFSKNTADVMDQAAVLAKGLGAKLWIVHVTSDALQRAYEATQFYGFTPELAGGPDGDVEMARELCAREYKQEHESLLNWSSKMRQEGVDAQAMLLKSEDAAGLILEKAEDFDVDIIVMGSHGHGLLRKMLTGSVAEAVLRRAYCSVLIVPPPPE